MKSACLCSRVSTKHRKISPGDRTSRKPTIVSRRGQLRGGGMTCRRGASGSGLPCRPGPSACGTSPPRRGDDKCGHRNSRVGPAADWPGRERDAAVVIAERRREGGERQPATASSHQERLAPPSLSDRWCVREGTFAGTRANGRDAPTAVINIADRPGDLTACARTLARLRLERLIVFGQRYPRLFAAGPKMHSRAQP
jgi:hypothetical protein